MNVINFASGESAKIIKESMDNRYMNVGVITNCIELAKTVLVRKQMI